MEQFFTMPGVVWDFIVIKTDKMINLTAAFVTWIQNSIMVVIIIFRTFAIIPIKSIVFLPGTLKELRRTQLSAWTHLRKMRIRIAMHFVTVVIRTYTILYVMKVVNLTIEQIGIAQVATRA